MSEIRIRTMPVFGEPSVCLQEVPDNISLVFSVMGCPLLCKGCHSPHLRGTKDANQLGTTSLLSYLVKYKGLVSCICFMGGDQYSEVLVECLKLCKDMGYKTCLYTGRPGVVDAIWNQLDFIKTGPYVERRGGLDVPDTNQVFTRTLDGETLNHLFRRSE